LIDGNEKPICRLSFEFWSPYVIEKRSKDCRSSDYLITGVLLFGVIARMDTPKYGETLRDTNR